MLKPEQVPDEVVEAFVDAFHGKDMTRKAAIAAALNAWPEVELRPGTEQWGRTHGAHLYLPLPQEPSA